MYVPGLERCSGVNIDRSGNLGGICPPSTRFIRSNLPFYFDNASSNRNGSYRVDGAGNILNASNNRTLPTYIIRLGINSISNRTINVGMNDTFDLIAELGILNYYTYTSPSFDINDTIRLNITSNPRSNIISNTDIQRIDNKTQRTTFRVNNYGTVTFNITVNLISMFRTSDPVTINVNSIQPTNISIPSGKNIQLVIGNTFTLNPEVLPSNAKQNITFTITDSTIATLRNTISSTRSSTIITAVKVGTTTIKLIAKDSITTLEEIVTVTVVPPCDTANCYPAQYNSYIQNKTWPANPAIPSCEFCNIRSTTFISKTDTGGYFPIDIPGTTISSLVFALGINATSSYFALNTDLARPVRTIVLPPGCSFILQYPGISGSPVSTTINTTSQISDTIYDIGTIVANIYRLISKSSGGNPPITFITTKPCNTGNCLTKQQSLTASFQPWNSTSLSECNSCTGSLTGSYNPCTSPKGDCINTQTSLTASNIKWSGSSLAQCQACGSLKNNSFDPCKSASCAAKQQSLTASYLPWNSKDLAECNYCDQTGSYEPCAPGGDCEKTQTSLTASNIKWAGSSLPQCQTCGSLKQNNFDPCKSASCEAKKKSLSASFQPWNSKDLAECNYCDQTGSYNPCSASGDCATTQANLTASNVKWSGSSLPECQACGSLKNNSFDPCKSASCRDKQSFLTKLFQPWNSRDIPECDKCDEQTGSYDPCSASGDCEKTQTSLTASNVKWSGSSLPQCQACGSLKNNSFDPCKSASCKAKQESLTASFQPWNSRDIPECDKCDEQTGSYEPCAPGGDCEKTQASLTASNVKWSGSSLPQCQACGSLKNNSFDPCKSASCKAKQESLTASFQPWNSATIPECDKCDEQTGSYEPCAPGSDCEAKQSALTASNIPWSGSDLPQCQACGTLKQNSFDPCKSASCQDKQSFLTKLFQPWNSKDIPECNYCGGRLTGSYDPCTASGDCETTQSSLTASGIPWSGSSLAQCQNCAELKKKSWAPPVASSSSSAPPVASSSSSAAPFASSSSSAAPVASSSSSWTPFGSSSSSAAPIASSSSLAPPAVASSSSSAAPLAIASSSSSFWDIVTSIGSSSSSWLPFARPQQPARQELPQPQPQKLTMRNDGPAPPLQSKQPQTYLPTLPPKPPVIVQLNNVNKPPEPKWSMNYPKKVFNCDTNYKTTDPDGKTIRKTQCL